MMSEENVLAMGIKELCLKPLDKKKLTAMGVASWTPHVVLFGG